MVYYTLPDGEIVNDALQVTFTQILRNTVRMQNNRIIRDNNSVLTRKDFPLHYVCINVVKTITRIRVVLVVKYSLTTID